MKYLEKIQQNLTYFSFIFKRTYLLNKIYSSQNLQKRPHQFAAVMYGRAVFANFGMNWFFQERSLKKWALCIRLLQIDRINPYFTLYLCFSPHFFNWFIFKWFFMPSWHFFIIICIIFWEFLGMFWGSKIWRRGFCCWRI